MSTKRYVRVALSVALVVGFAGLLALKGYTLSQSSGRGIGFVYNYWQKPEGILVLEVDPGFPADRAGLRPGDMILAVDGARLANPGHTSYHKMTRKFQRGRSVEFNVQRAGKIFNVHVSPGVPISWKLFLLDAFGVLCFLALALLALPPGLAGDLRARLLLGYAGVQALCFVMPQDVIGWPWLDFATQSVHNLSRGLQMGLGLHLASLITGRPAWLRRRPRVVPLYYFIGLGLGLLGWATYIAERILKLNVFPWNTMQALELILRIALISELVIVTLLAIQALRHPEPKGRNQARLVLTATVLPILCWAALTVASRFGLTPSALWGPLLGTLLLLCCSAAYFVAIFRYDLLDIERVVRRSLIYTVLTTALVLVFYAAQGAGGILLSYALGGGGAVWAVALATLLLGLLFVPLRRFLHRLIGERFFPERHALRQRLVTLAGELPALGKLPRMGEHLVATLRDLFLARSATLLIADPEARLLRILAVTDGENGVSSSRKEEPSLLLALDDPAIDHLRRSRGPLRIENLSARSAAFAHRLKNSDPASLIVPLLNQKKLVGALIVGPKAVGSYPAEELDLLNLLAHHVAIVFENARLFESATYEGLTGLLRREAILEQLDGELERAQRYGRPLAVAVADLDHFKKVNDLHGHLAGDTLLRHVSQVISSELRSTDRIGRYGGEEFLLVFPETDLQQAGMVAEKIRTLVQETAVSIQDGELLRATVSIGLASLNDVATGEGSVSARDLIAAADRALYLAKDLGRNRVHPQAATFEELAG